MGNLISSHAGPVNPMSGASTIIGFVSFAFTLGSEVHDLLGNLKQSLYEERTHLRTVRRRCRAEYDAAAFRLLAESVRHLISEFKFLEEPFLSDAARDLVDQQQYQNRSGGGGAAATAPYYSGNPPSYYHHHNHNGNSNKRNSHHSNTKRHSHPPGYHADSEQHDYDVFSDYFVTGQYYKKMDMGLRIKWLRRRSKVMDLSQRLANLQTRRIARQVTDLSITLKYVQGVLGGTGLGRAIARKVGEEEGDAAADADADADIFDYRHRDGQQLYSRGDGGGGGGGYVGGRRNRDRDRDRGDTDTRG